MKRKLPSSKGFTLIELMVVVTIIAFLSVIGIVAFTNAQKQARDGRRRADIESIATALETQRDQSAGTYPNPVTGSMFASGKKPQDPSTNTDYNVTYGTGNTTFTACTTLEIPTGQQFCKYSQQ